MVIKKYYLNFKTIASGFVQFLEKSLQKAFLEIKIIKR